MLTVASKPIILIKTGFYGLFHALMTTYTESIYNTFILPILSINFLIFYTNICKCELDLMVLMTKGLKVATVLALLDLGNNLVTGEFDAYTTP